ncbi:MAG TPA: Ig-like domain-containing protein, partial [Frankiaceae bacterium]|nr:Ig-like domain-containing protein [Frankiaceae bacterium]
ESDRDTPDQRGTLALAAGETRAGINVITNVDTIPPSVLAVSPGGDTTNIRIDTSILVKFSERIDDTTLQGSFRLHVEGQVNALGGSGTLVNNGRNLVFNPTNPLLFGTRYVLDITTGLMDREGVPMAAPFSTAFTTQAAPPVAIADIQPRAAAPGSFITILGTGYDPMGTDSVQFAVGVVPVVVRWPAVSVTPTSMLVRVPPSAVSGPVQVFVNGDTSNVFDFTVLPAAVTSAPSFVTDVTLSFSPTDVALAPAGATAYAVGSGGLAVVDLQSGQVQLEAIGAARSLALTPDGRRAVVTRTTSADVVVVDVAYGSGTFGQVLGTTPLPDGARPAGVAIAPTGRVAWVTDPALRMVHQIDIDPLSVTCYSVMGEAADSVVSMGDGIAVSPAGGAVYYASSNAGARVVRLPGGSPGGASSIVSSGGVAADPAADEVLFADAGLLGSSVLAVTVTGDSAFASTTRFMGGEVRDVAYGRDGNTAYLVNAATNQLQMISTDPDGGNYLSKLAEVGTGASPVAVAVSGFGDVIATADYGSRTISIFRTGGTSGLVRAVRAVASPGDVVALQGSGAPFGAGSQVDVGTGPFAPSFRAPGALGAAFVVPPGAQRDGSVAAVDSTGMRTLGLALRVVDPIDTPTPRRTGFELHQDSLMCLLGFTYGLIEHVRTSPDGGLVAVSRVLTTPTSCGSTLELFDMRDFAVMRLGSLSATMPGLAPASDQVLDMEYTTDGRQLWAATSDLSVKIVDTDPSSPSYATVVNTLGLTVAGSPGSVAADPLGRFMAVGDYAADSVRFFGTAGANRVGAVGMPAVTWALAFSPDGRYLVAAGGGQVSVLDINTFTPLAPSPVHGAGAAVPYDVAVARDGRNAMVLFPGG